MSAREEILLAVRAARPAPLPHPDVQRTVRGFPAAGDDLVGRFVAAASAAGARVVEGGRAEAARLVAQAYPEARVVASVAAGVAGTVPLVDEPGDLAGLDLFVCEGRFGVAENGAVWITGCVAGARAALFLAPHEVIVLDRQAIVANLHEAYERVDFTVECFGTFVAGPSKTADIEQALVIGAHGPKTLTIILVDGSV